MLLLYLVGPAPPLDRSSCVIKSLTPPSPPKCITRYMNGPILHVVNNQVEYFRLVLLPAVILEAADVVLQEILYDDQMKKSVQNVLKWINLFNYFEIIYIEDFILLKIKVGEKILN